jgi:iron complex outermembrane receptor protein
VLKDDSEGGTVEARWGEYYDGDGESMQIAANVGVPLTDAGFANFSVQFKEADATSRSVQRDDAAALVEAGNTDVLNPVQVWGSPEVRDDFTLFGNLGLDLGNGAEAYAFGNWAQRTVEGGFFFRDPTARPGVFNLDGEQPELLVADFTFGTEDDGIACPSVPLVM